MAPRAALVLLAAGVACYLAAGTFSQALLALDRGRAAAASWAVSVVVLIGSFAVIPGDVLMRSSAALACASLTAALALGMSVARMR